MPESGSSRRKPGPVTTGMSGCMKAIEQRAPTQAARVRREDRPYGVATANEACSAAREARWAANDTQTFLRCRPRIAPVTLSTLPAGHEASCTKAIS